MISMKMTDADEIQAGKTRSRLTKSQEGATAGINHDSRFALDPNDVAR